MSTISLGIAAFVVQLSSLGPLLPQDSVSARTNAPAAQQLAGTPRGPAEIEPLPEFAPDDFIILPLRIHLLRADGLADIDAGTLTDDDVLRIVTKANRVWQQAGIRWRLESIVREQAAGVDRFELAQSLKAQGWNHYLALRPESSRDQRLHHVYFIHEFNVNGVYLGNGVAFVKETAKLREVEGGIDEHIPRVMSHELGHSLGLPHRQDRTNLMASGTTGTSFNADEVKRSRAIASKLVSAAPAGIMARRAKDYFEAGRWSESLALDALLLTLPGNSPLKDDAWTRYTAALCCGAARRTLSSNHGRP